MGPLTHLLQLFRGLTCVEKNYYAICNRPIEIIKFTSLTAMFFQNLLLFAYSASPHLLLSSLTPEPFGPLLSSPSLSVPVFLMYLRRWQERWEVPRDISIKWLLHHRMRYAPDFRDFVVACWSTDEATTGPMVLSHSEESCGSMPPDMRDVVCKEENYIVIPTWGRAKQVDPSGRVKFMLRRSG